MYSEGGCGLVSASILWEINNFTTLILVQVVVFYYDILYNKKAVSDGRRMPVGETDQYLHFLLAAPCTFSTLLCANSHCPVVWLHCHARWPPSLPSLLDMGYIHTV